MPVSEATYERIALEDPDGQWELGCHGLRQKPAMTFEHNDCGRILGFQLQSQLPLDEWIVAVNSGRVRLPDGRHYIPDVMVFRRELARPLMLAMRLEAYSEPLPLVVEIWSPSTGGYDLAEKLDGYRARSDLEIWFIHPYNRTLRRWTRQDDGSYEESLLSEGELQPVGLPDVTIVFESLFRLG